MNCKECGINLNALNMSDIEQGICTDCVDLTCDFILKHNNGDELDLTCPERYKYGFN